VRRIQLLDCARFLAAISVLGYHYLWNGIQNGKIRSITLIPGLSDVAKYGYLGLELFFVISGYVIFFSAHNRSPREFAVSRALRLYPAFWAAVLITSCFAFEWGQGTPMQVHLTQVVASLTMIPERLGFQPVDGVYWTLALELAFYCAVLGALLLGLQRYLIPMFLLWPLGILAARLLDVDLSYLHGYFCYFAAGAAFAIDKHHRSIWSLGSLAISLYLCVTLSIAQIPSGQSPLIVGTIVVLMFAFFFVLNQPAAAAAEIPGSRTLGALTYPIYLVHAHIGYMVLSRFATDQNKTWVYPLLISIVIGVAYLLHVLVERRLKDFWQRLFQATLGRAMDAASNSIRWATLKCRAFVTSGAAE
jgi:peptidoglycan/LPS O-acetylase OafA/YrhL